MTPKIPPRSPSPQSARPATPAPQPSPHPSPPPGAATATRTPDPTPNPLRNPPPPNLPKRGPGRPRKGEGPAAAATATAGGAPPPSPADAAPPRRELPTDPAAREAALASVAGECSMILAVLDVAATRLPPGRPLSEHEKAAIAEPLAQVVYKHGGNIPPEVALIAALGMVGAGRYVEYRETLPKKLARGAAVASPLADDRAPAVAAA